MSPYSGPRVYSESGIYSNLLLSQGRGFPLYRPEPINLPTEYQRKGVAIGDVGTVTVEGDFDFFFNIYLSANDRINANVPADFVPLSLYHSGDIKKYSFNPGNHVSTASIYKSSTVGGAFVFNCTAPNGAVLALPHGADLEKLGKLAFMRQYAAKNAKSWYRYLNETRGCELVNGSLFLITGCEKARSWGMATFHDVLPQKEFQLSFQPTPEAGDCWEAPHCCYKHIYPPLNDSPLNQTTFIHAFTISLPETIWETLFGDVAIRQLVDLPAPMDRSGRGFVPYGSQGSSFTSFFNFFGGNAPTGGRQCTGQDGIISDASPIPKVC
ncbi:hypothetical protein B0H14DRAFT_1220735 [Mycena olivaceomarginata]|nr:hypothetical protein B0H14DRAFT_1220735 [Mycena olivaceomarginata]